MELCVATIRIWNIFFPHQKFPGAPSVLNPPPPPVPGNRWCDVCLLGLASSRCYDAVMESQSVEPLGLTSSYPHAHVVHMSLVRCFLLLSSISLCEEWPWTCLFLINLFTETYPLTIPEARPMPPHLWGLCLSPPASGGTRGSHGL